jgi:ribosomal protein S21
MRHEQRELQWIIRFRRQKYIGASSTRGSDTSPSRGWRAGKFKRAISRARTVRLMAVRDTAEESSEKRIQASEACAKRGRQTLGARVHCMRLDHQSAQTMLNVQPGHRAVVGCFRASRHTSCLRGARTEVCMGQRIFSRDVAALVPASRAHSRRMYPCQREHHIMHQP